MAVKGVASQSSPALGPWLPALVPALLDAASHPRPEVSQPQRHEFLGLPKAP